MAKTISEKPAANGWGGARNFKDHRPLIKTAKSFLRKDMSLPNWKISEIWKRVHGVFLTACRVGQIFKENGLEPDSRKRKRRGSFKLDSPEPEKRKEPGRRRGRRKNPNTMKKLKRAEKKLRQIAKHKNRINFRQGLRVVAMLDLALGMTVKEIVERYGVGKTMVHKWQNILIDKGVDGLLNLGYGNNHHRCKLTSEQILLLCRFLLLNPANPLRKIRQWIEEEFDVHYSVPGVRGLVNRMGFTYKNTKPIPQVPDVKKQKKFLAKLLHRMSREERESVFLYMDSMHPRLHGKTGGVWVPEKVTPVIQQATGRSGVNVLGVLDTKLGKVHHLFSDRINSDVVIEMLERVEKEYKGKKRIYVILDNARYHKSKKVMDWIKSRPRTDRNGERNPRILLYFLPPYCPHFNKIERLWGVFHKVVTVNKYYENLKEFTAAVLEFLDTLEENWEEYATYVDADFHIIEKKKFMVVSGPIVEVLKSHKRLRKQLKKKKQYKELLDAA